MNSHRPTPIRFTVIAAATCMSVLLYLDRFCISFAETYIQQDLGLSDIQVGWMLSIFFATYALGQVPAGWLTDRYGSRIMLTTYILAWSLFTALTGLAAGFFMLILLRIGFGFAQAGAYPTGASIISKWVPFTMRGSASSVVAFGGRVGGWAALLVTGYLIVWLTPLSTPAELGRADLLEPVRLCHALHAQQEAGSERHVLGSAVWNHLDAEVRPRIAAQAARYGEAVERAAAERGADDGAARPVDIEQPLPEDLFAPLLAGLNRFIREYTVTAEQVPPGMSVEAEVRRRLDEPVEARSQSERERINRLVLEALHPDSVRKLYGLGWRPTMYIYGALGILVAGLVWLTCYNRPSEHPLCNEAERRLIESDPRMTGTGGTGRHGIVALLPRLLTSFSMWMICLSQFCTNVGWIFIVTWAPRYFQEVHHVPIERRALMVSLPPLIGWFGMLLGGLVTDRLVKIVGLRWGRALPLSVSRFMAMMAYVVCLWNPSPWLAVAMFSLVAFSTDLGTASTWAFKQDVGGRYVGSILGWGNMWGNFGAFFAPTFVIWLVGESGHWTLAFVTCAVAFLIAGIAALGVNATIPIAPPDEDVAADSGGSEGKE